MKCQKEKKKAITSYKESLDVYFCPTALNPKILHFKWYKMQKSRLVTSLTFLLNSTTVMINVLSE